MIVLLVLILVIIMTLLGTLVWGKRNYYQRKWFLSTTDLYYSDDPTEWTVTSHPNFTTMGTFQVIRFNGKYICRIVSNATDDYFRPSLMYSTDGINWTDIYLDTLYSDESHLLAHNNYNTIVFALMSEYFTFYYSNDGLLWNETSTIFPEGYADSVKVVYNNGLFHLYGYIDGDPTGLVYYSTDGRYWSEINNSVLTGIVPQGIVYGNSLWVMTTYNRTATVGNNIFTSTDGKTWTNQNIDIFRSSNIISYGNGRWIVQGRDESSNSQFHYSNDGENWTISTFDDGAGDTARFSSSSLAYYPSVSLWISGNTVLQDGSNLITYSTDGERWSLTNLPQSSYLSGDGIEDITYGEGKLIAVGYTETDEPILLQSTDGINWEDVPNDFTDPLYQISYL